MKTLANLILTKTPINTPKLFTTWAQMKFLLIKKETK